MGLILSYDRPYEFNGTVMMLSHEISFFPEVSTPQMKSLRIGLHYCDVFTLTIKGMMKVSRG